MIVPVGLVLPSTAAVGNREDKVPNSDAGFVPGRFTRKSARGGLAGVMPALRLGARSAAVAGLVMFGCGTPHATFDITAPSSATAGSPFTITVTAMVGANRDTVINSSIHFTSSDGAAVLPPDYYFTANDAGSHTFINGVTLMTDGSQTITGTDVGAPGINGTASITVSPPNFAQLTASESSHFGRLHMDLGGSCLARWTRGLGISVWPIDQVPRTGFKMEGRSYSDPVATIRHNPAFLLVQNRKV